MYYPITEGNPTTCRLSYYQKSTELVTNFKSRLVLKGNLGFFNVALHLLVTSGFHALDFSLVLPVHTTYVCSSFLADSTFM